MAFAIIILRYEAIFYLYIEERCGDIDDFENICEQHVLAANLCKASHANWSG
jgi:hypothetical protein